MQITEFDLDIDHYMLDCAAKGLSQKTMKSYEQTLKLFAKYMSDTFGIQDSKMVKADHLRAYVRHLEERGKYKMTASVAPKNYPERRQDYGKKISTSTISNYVRNIKAYYSYLYDERITRKNIMKSVKSIKPKRKVKQLMEDSEINLFLKAFDITKFDQYRDWIIAQLIFDCGARITELTGTIETDYDFKNNALLLRETKNGKERFVYFSNKMRTLLKSWFNYKDRYIHSSHMFPTRSGNRLQINSIERSFRLRSHEVGLTNITPHLLRNNFAKRYLLNGGDLATLSRLLGHASVEVTANIYLDFADKELMRKYQQHSPLQHLKR